MMGAEDFSYMLEARPGAFIFIGNGDSAGLHHPAYNFNDEVIPFGTSYWVKLVETALRGLTFGDGTGLLRRSRRRFSAVTGGSAQRTEAVADDAGVGRPRPQSREPRLEAAPGREIVDPRAFDRGKPDRGQEGQALHHQHHARTD